MRTFKNLMFLMMICICFIFLQKTHSQQTYINNEQLDCDQNDTSTSGFLCNNSLQTSCQSYLTIRVQPPYDSASDIGVLLRSDASMIAELNNITHVDDKIPTDTLIIAPVTNCSCSGNFFQYNSTYRLSESENYFTLANDTYQGLTTCQALINQNPQYGERNLYAGIRVSVPLRCACPSRNQTSHGVKFLLSYLVTWGDYIASISDAFGVDEQSVLDANELSSDDVIYPFTPVLVPLKAQPTYDPNKKSLPEAKAPTIPIEDNSNSNNNSSSKKWVFVGIGIALFLLVIILLGYWFLCCPRGHSSQPQGKEFSVSTGNQTTPQKNSQSFAVSSENVRILLDSSFNVYNLEELQTATKQFSEDNRIKASVYRGMIKGDNAAIKRMKGNALKELSILKQINHSSVVRLSGYCMHEGDTYFVYEFMENGSLSDWLHEDKTSETPVARLGWKQRVQIAYDVADGLNYLHNYVNPAQGSYYFLQLHWQQWKDGKGGAAALCIYKPST
ncbi:Lysm receptor kinase [Thalictrum thalictroides]|uniref:Lysm receptor kinase n=1 Tax=Thalictrum thalictroides TaxID=46969 RepID=A0A7J6W0U3_THATH|nr:Lysm receptor kinase [Thalictrum thalictroides]